MRGEIKMVANSREKSTTREGEFEDLVLDSNDNTRAIQRLGEPSGWTLPSSMQAKSLGSRKQKLNRWVNRVRNVFAEMGTRVISFWRIISMSCRRLWDTKQNGEHRLFVYHGFDQDVSKINVHEKQNRIVDKSRPKSTKRAISRKVGERTGPTTKGKSNWFVFHLTRCVFPQRRENIPQ